MAASASPTDILDALLASLPLARREALNERLGEIDDEVHVRYILGSERGEHAMVAARQAAMRMRVFVLESAVWHSQQTEPEPPPENVERRKLRYSHLPWYTWRKPAAADAPQCAICLEQHKEGEEIVKLLCEHEFHRECAWEWLKGHATCPKCRFKTM